MKQGQLRIGNKGEGKFVKIPFDEPETIDEFKSQFGDNESFLLDMSLRGVRIRIQDLTRDLVAEGLKANKAPEVVVDEVIAWLGSHDITEKKERKAPGPRKPVEVVAEAKASYSNDELRAMLEKAGVKLVIAGQAVGA